MNKKLLANKVKYESAVFPTHSYGEVIVLNYINNRKITVQFLDTLTTVDVRLVDLQRGQIKDHAKPSVCGVGIYDVNRNISETKTREYSLWVGVLKRCYANISREYDTSYLDCSVSDTFKYYSRFKKWCSQQAGFHYKDSLGKPFQLDKDILVKGNKVYSEYTCCFVPQEINLSLINCKSVRGIFPVGVHQNKRNGKYRAAYSTKEGKVNLGQYDTPELAFQAYKQAKEDYIKALANKWKDQIDQHTYEALMNWEIEITD